MQYLSSIQNTLVTMISMNVHSWTYSDSRNIIHCIGLKTGSYAVRYIDLSAYCIWAVIHP